MSEFKKGKQREITEWMKKDIPNKVEVSISGKKEQSSLNIVKKEEEKEKREEVENKDIIEEIEKLKIESIEEKIQILEDVKQKIRKENWPKRVNCYLRIRTLGEFSSMLSKIHFDDESLIKKREEIINYIEEEIEYLTPERWKDNFPSNNKKPFRY